MKNLKKGKEYDEDARQMTLQEMLNDVGASPALSGQADPVQHHRFRSVLELEKLELPVPKTISPDVRTSVLKSLGYLQPLLQK